MSRIKIIPYKRKKEGKTDYKKRLKLLISGTERLVVRKTNTNTIVQIVQYNDDGDKVLVTVSSSSLKKLGWKYSTSNIPSAYLTGLLAGKKAQEKKITSAIVDLGLYTPVKGSKLYAAVKGAIDSGLDIPHSEEIYPSEDRLKGKHIAEYGKTSNQFKNKPTDIEESFDDIKKKILNK